MQKHHRRHGFTLIELLIALAIVGIIAAIAYPAYTESVRKSRRADAAASLMELAQFMALTYADNKTYQPGGTTPTLGFTEAPREGSPKVYDLTLVATATTYTLTATPKNAQAADKCGKLTLTHTGQKGIASATSGTTVADCW
jgi:type IV pilus assembly protein PilE